MGQGEGRPSDPWFRELAYVERELDRVRASVHSLRADVASIRLAQEARLVKLETRLATYATLGGAIAGAIVAVILRYLPPA